jgi:hypothetical protein
MYVIGLPLLLASPTTIFAQELKKFPMIRVFTAEASVCSLKNVSGSVTRPLRG